jgi:acyl-CoA synthetase (AMP-forming)/AMP-acid ligase II
MRLTGPPAPARRFPTLAHALGVAAEHSSGVTFVDLRERESSLRWTEVEERAARAGAAMAARGVRPGDRVAIVLRTEPAFLDAFFGAWRCGAVPVPLYPPVRLGRLDEWVATTARMLEVSGARLVISGGGTKALLGQVLARVSPPLGLLDARELTAGQATLRHLPTPEDLGLIQFSSGSTVDPKPVALTHAALQAQADALVAVVRPTDADVVCSWLPLYHDMGLIGGLLAAMSYPAALVLIAPEHFLARPAIWLRAMARHRASISVAPSFAYAYCADRVSDDDLAGHSLSGWRLALDGAEPVSGDALRRFAARFARFGLDPAALVPVYGLSEAALAVCFAAPGQALAGARIDPVRLATDGLVAPGSREVMSVGRPIPGMAIEVRRADGGLAGEGRLGRLWVCGPSLLREYLGDPAATALALVDGWLDTGDLGFVVDGKLHIHGRDKDLVIVRGANRAPEEIEAALSGLPGLRPGCAVALGFTPAEGGEALLLLAERGRASDQPDALVCEAILRAVTDRTGLTPHTIRLLAPGSLPRTSSGKLRRQEALRRFQAGTLAPPRRMGALGLALEVARSRLAPLLGQRRSTRP